MVRLEVGLTGFIRGSDGVTSYSDGLEEGLSIIGRLAVVYIHRSQHGLGFSDAACHIIVIIIFVGSIVVSSNTHVSFPLQWCTIRTVAVIMTITVSFLALHCGDIAFSPSWPPAVAAVGRTCVLIILALLDES